MKSNGTWAPKRGSERDLQTWDVGCGEWRVNVDDSLTESGYPVAAVTWGSGDCTGPRAKRIESRGSNGARPSGDVDGDLPKLPSLRQPLERRARLGQRIHPVHDGPQLAPPQPPYDLRILDEGPQRRAHDRPVMPEHAAQIDRHLGPCRGPTRHQPPAARQHAQGSVPRRLADVLDDHLHPPLAGERAHLLGDVLGAMV